MCLLESELESQLGEFHVRMKGNTSLHSPGPMPAHLVLMSLCLLLQGWQVSPGSVLVTSTRCVGLWAYGRGSAPLPPCGPRCAWGTWVGFVLGAGAPIPMSLLLPQIFMKYGRQRWKLRGRIEVNSKQVWDSEEMVFLPLITEFLSIKVWGPAGRATPGPGGGPGPHPNPARAGDGGCCLVVVASWQHQGCCVHSCQWARLILSSSSFSR